MNLDVVAEVIETKEQSIQLQELGCHFGQGFLFSKPLAARAKYSVAIAKYKIFKLQK